MRRAICASVVPKAILDAVTVAPVEPSRPSSGLTKYNQLLNKLLFVARLTRPALHIISHAISHAVLARWP